MNDFIKQELKRLEQCNEDVFLAGGCIRDYYFNKPIKDYDIFVLNKNNYCELELHSIYDKNNLTFHTSKFYRNYEDGVMRDDVHGVYQKINWDLDFSITLDVDYIVMRSSSIEETIFNFDTSICQCYGVLEGDELVYYASEDFLEYERNNVIYFYPDIETCDGHIARVKKKFPNAIYKEKLSKDINRGIVKIGINNG